MSALTLRLFGHAQGDFATAIAMDQIMGTNPHPGELPRDTHRGQAAGERLLVNMRMRQHTGREYLAIRGKQLPAVGIVIPTGVGRP